MPIKIRTYILDDLAAVSKIEQEVFGDFAYPLFYFRQAFDVFGDLFHVAETEEGEIVGYILGILPSGSQEGWILSLAVQKENRRKGIAKILVESVLTMLSHKGARSVLLTVEPDNEETITFYRNLHFHEIKREDNYFGNGETRIVMRRNL